MEFERGDLVSPTAEVPVVEGEVQADVVFTGGYSLYEAKRDRHPRGFPFPSSVDVAHFERARHVTESPLDPRAMPSPRVGFCGVIDERMDLGLIDGIAAARPDWQLVMIGPVVKIDAAQLPRREHPLPWHEVVRELTGLHCGLGRRDLAVCA